MHIYRNCFLGIVELPVSFIALRKLTVRMLLVPFFVLGGLFFVTSILNAQFGERIPYFAIREHGSGGVITLSSQTEPVIEVGAWSTSGKATVTLFKVDRDFALNYLRHTSEGKQITGTQDTSSLQQVTQFTQDIASSYSNGSRVTLPLEEAGIWYIQMSINGKSNDALIFRSSFGGVVKSMGDSYAFWTQDFKTRRSIDQVKVTEFDLTDSVTELGTGSTNSNGTIQLPFSTKADIALLEKDGQTALLPINLQYFNSGYAYTRFAQIGDEYRYYLFTDRPIYKPGDTVFYKGILRQEDDARYSIPSGTARVKLYKGWDERDLVFEKLVTISADGSINGEYAFPDTVTPGEYTLHIQAVSDAEIGWTGGRAIISVEEYRKPEYYLEMEAAQDEVVVGEPSAVTVRGAFFSGQPLAGSKVGYTVYSQEAYQPQTQASIKYMYEDNDYNYGYWGAEKVDQGTVDLDGTGSAQIELPLSAEVSTGKMRVFAVEAEFIDESGNPVQARKNVLVHPGRWGIYRNDEGWKASKVGEDYTLPLILVPTEDTTDVANIALTAKIKRSSWIKKVTDGKTYYDNEEEELPEKTVVTDRKGTAKLTFRPEHEGSYTITVSSIDSENRRVEKEFYAWISNSSGYWYYGGMSTNLTVNADKESYKPGETANLTIYSEIPDRDVFLVLQRARVDRYQVVRLTGNIGTAAVPITDADMPNTFVRVYSFAANDLDANRLELKVSAEKRKITVDLETDRQYYGPGDTVNLTVKTTNNQGQGVPAEVAVWSVDKALFELSTDMRQNIFKFFWFDRYESAMEGHSLEHINVYAAERGGGCFVAGTQILMADGSLKDIEKVKVGDHVRTRKSEQDDTLVSAKVTDTHQIEEAGYLIINHTLKVTPNHILWVNDTWKSASEIQVDDRMVAATGEDILVESVEWFAQKVQVYNLTVENYHTYFADGFWVHNQKDGGARSVLKDAAYWNPTVRTDGSGIAKITFKLPDNLTTWVISGVAATNDTSVGETKTEVITQKDVVMRPVVPNILRVGDTINLSALLHNFTDTDHTFTASLDLPGTEISQATQSGVLVVGKGGREQLFWQVKPQEANPNTKATFMAKAEGDLSDGIAQPLPILPFGFKEGTSTAAMNSVEYPLQLPADTDERYSSIQLALSPTMLGTLPAAMEYLVDYPYGCVEQTTSRFVPAVIAKTNSAVFADTFADKDVDDIVKKGIARLDLLHNPDGGWGWWRTGTNASSSDPFITAYVVEYLVAAKKAGSPVPDSMIAAVTSYLKNPSTSSEETILKTYALQLLAEEEGAVQVPVSESLTSDLLSYAIMINVKNGNKNPDTNGVTLLLNKLEKEGELASLPPGKGGWFGSRDASTAMGLRALTLAQVDRATTLQLARYLLERRTKNYWSNTFATAQVAQAIVDYAKTGGDLTPAYSYTVMLNDTTIAAGAVNAGTTTIKPIDITVSEAKKGVLRVKKEGEGTLYSSLQVSAFRTDAQAKAESNGLSITRSYVPGKGVSYYPSVGDVVQVTLQVDDIPENTSYLVIEDQLPAGMIPVNTNLKNEGGQDNYYYGGYWYGEEQQTKKDGAVFLVSMRNGFRSNTVTYQARVIASGEFRAPPAVAFDMYNSDVRGRTTTEKIKITAEPQRDPTKAVTSFVKNLGDTLPRWLRQHMRELIGAAVLLAGLGVTIYTHRRRLQQLAKGKNIENDTPHKQEPPVNVPPQAI